MNINGMDKDEVSKVSNIIHKYCPDFNITTLTYVEFEDLDIEGKTNDDDWFDKLLDAEEELAKEYNVIFCQIHKVGRI